MKPIIHAENLGKEYTIDVRKESYDTLRDALMRALRSPFRRGGGRGTEKIWAVRDLSFSAMPGDVIGVIGRNGAGKSTLLKILARITEPTTGRVELYGRVGSLLEVGTGFHQELTGRENVYLNGAILGMRRAEISRKFDDIVAFAEVERFVDTPVKRYSSGMYLRLAFSVAAFLESEILLVDEVLAVGDANFQKKCLGKMRDVSAGGRTVLFVSHNMAAIESLCTRCLYICEGRAQGFGVPHELIGRYLSAEAAPASAVKSLCPHPGRRAGSELLMRSVSLTGEGGTAASSIRMGGALSFRVDYCSETRPIRPALGLVIKNNYGLPVFGISNRVIRGSPVEEPSWQGSITCHLRNLPLMPDTYAVDLYLGDLHQLHQDYDVVYDAVTFEIVPADVFGSGQLPGAECGSVFWPASFTHAAAEAPVTPNPGRP
jgi:lipopolysaccharide transport system ATP-binding protein